MPKEERSSTISQANYESTRDYYDKTKDAQQSALDKHILTLSAGAFALSLSSFIVSGPEYIWLLKVAWFGFGASLLGTLFSMAKSNEHLSKAIDILDDWRRVTIAAGSSEMPRTEKSTLLFKRLADENYRDKLKAPSRVVQLNRVTRYAFALGVIALGTFSFLNIDQKGELMPKNPTAGVEFKKPKIEKGDQNKGGVEKGIESKPLKVEPPSNTGNDKEK